MQRLPIYIVFSRCELIYYNQPVVSIKTMLVGVNYNVEMQLLFIFIRAHLILVIRLICLCEDFVGTFNIFKVILLPLLSGPLEGIVPDRIPFLRSLIICCCCMPLVVIIIIIIIILSFIDLKSPIRYASF